MSTPAKLYTLELTEEQLDYLVYGQGYLLAAASKMDDSHRFWIQEHHRAVMPKLIGAKKRVDKVEPV
jgi:hypothetical protein